VGNKVVAILIITLFALAACGSHVTFEQAVKDPSLRQNYIQQILKKHSAPPQVKILEYATLEVLEELRKTHHFVPEPDTLMAVNPLEEIPIPLVGTRDVSVRITAFPGAFDVSYVQNERDFIAALLHEYRHVLQLNTMYVAGFSYRDDFLVMEGAHKGEHSFTVINLVYELDAFRDEIKRVTSKDWGSSTLFIQRRHALYAETYLNLLKYLEKGPQHHPQVEERMKIEFFAPWLRETVLFSLTPEGKPKLIHPRTKEEYTLPEEVLSK